MTKDNTSQLHCLDVRYLSKHSLLLDGYSGQIRWRRFGKIASTVGYKCKGDSIQLEYAITDTAQNYDYSIQIARTACHYGGSRSWLVCPHSGCGRRVVGLYLRQGVFWCRHCHRLNYESQQSSLENKLILKAEKIRERLQWEAGILNGTWQGKPTGMHWRTYWPLLDQYNVLVNLIWKATKNRFQW